MKKYLEHYRHSMYVRIQLLTKKHWTKAPVPCRDFSPGFVKSLVPLGPLSGFRPNEYKIMDRMKKNLKQANPNFHMQICLSQQSLSPSHHFLHSNAFSHLYKIPPSATRRGCARFADLQNRYFCTFDLFCEKMLCRFGVLHALICIFYYEE